MKGMCYQYLYYNVATRAHHLSHTHPQVNVHPLWVITIVTIFMADDLRGLRNVYKLHAVTDDHILIRWNAAVVPIGYVALSPGHSWFSMLHTQHWKIGSGLGTRPQLCTTYTNGGFLASSLMQLASCTCTTKRIAHKHAQSIYCNHCCCHCPI